MDKRARSGTSGSPNLTRQTQTPFVARVNKNGQANQGSHDGCCDGFRSLLSAGDRYGFSSMLLSPVLDYLVVEAVKTPQAVGHFRHHSSGRAKPARLARLV